MTRGIQLSIADKQKCFILYKLPIFFQLLIIFFQKMLTAKLKKVFPYVQFDKQSAIVF